MVYGANGDTGRKPKMTKAKKPANGVGKKGALKGLKVGSKEYMAKLRSMRK